MAKAIPPNVLDLIQCSVQETDDADGVVWALSATYTKGQKVRHKHQSYESTVDSNKGNEPSKITSSGTENVWMPLGATVPYRLIDEFVESQTSGADGESLTFTVPFNRATAFGLLNLEGFTLTVEIEDDDEGLMFSETYNLIKDISDFSLWQYNYLPIENVDAIVKTGIPIVISGQMRVTITSGGDGSFARCGMVVVGRDVDLGGTLYGAQVGVLDFSRKETNDFGQTTLVKRSYASTASVDLYHHPDKADYVASTLKKLRAQNVLWVLDNQDARFSSLTIYGWLEDWRSVFEGPNEQQLALDIQGVI